MRYVCFGGGILDNTALGHIYIYTLKYAVYIYIDIEESNKNIPGLCKLLKSLGYLGQLRCGLRQEVPWFKSRLSNWIRIGVWESFPPIAEFLIYSNIYY